MREGDCQRSVLRQLTPAITTSKTSSEKNPRKWPSMVTYVPPNSGPFWGEIEMVRGAGKKKEVVFIVLFLFSGEMKNNAAYRGCR